MPVSEIIWSDTEQSIAQSAFQKAYQRETATLIEHIKEQSSQIEAIDDIWQMHDYLSARRHQIDGKYDYRYSSLVFVFAQLLKEGWLKVDDLKGLESDKLAKITALSRM
jgi:Photoprotection regulator fluorescence recovery protein